MDAKRPMSVTIAAVLLAMFCVLTDVSFPLWADMIQRDDGGAPAAIVYFTVAVGVAVIIVLGTTGILTPAPLPGLGGVRNPFGLDELGLAGAVHEIAARQNQNSLLVAVEAPETLPPLPAAVEVAAYRIAGEAITNVARHSGASRCEIHITLDEPHGSLHLEVSDDGRGIGEHRGSGVGLHSMRERAEELGGAFEVGASKEGGARVCASLPLGGSRR